MALEAVLVSQDHSLITSHNHNYYNISSNYNLYSYDLGNYYSFNSASEINHNQNDGFKFNNNKPWVDDFSNYSSPEGVINCGMDQQYLSGEARPSVVAGAAVDGGGGRRKRRKRSIKNKEEVEQQRMTHIAVERNRRKQMNDYLSVIRSLMPPSYSQRGDQASIVGGAINYVKELEQMVQSLQAHKQNQLDSSNNSSSEDQDEALMFGEFFSFPQFSSSSSSSSFSLNSNSSSSTDSDKNQVKSNNHGDEIEVRMVDGHANVRILTKKKQKQLLRMVDAFQGLRLSLLHLNVTTLHPFVLYTFNLKVEEGCQLNSVDDVAAATNHILASPIS